MGRLRSSSRGAVRPIQAHPLTATSSPEVVELTATSADAAAYMDAHLAGTVRRSLERCISEQPRDPIRFVAQSLHQLRSELDTEQAAASSATPVSNTAAEPPHGDPAATAPRRVAPAMVRLDDGVKYALRPLAQDFQRLTGAAAAGATTMSIFPAVQYRESIPTYEVAACLRQLHLVDPAVALVLLVEPPLPTTTTFFYEGVAYACAAASSAGRAVARSGPATTAPTADIASLQQALGTDKVHEFEPALRTAAAEAVPGVQIEFIPSVQADYLAAFDVMDRVVKATARPSSGGDGSRVPSPVRPARGGLPSVLFVSYRPDTAHLTYARLLSSYGPRYEAVQRGYLQDFRATQLERRRTYTFAYAMRHWAEVQRQRQPSTNSTRAPTSLVKSNSLAESKRRSVDSSTAAPTSEAATDKTAAGGAVPTSSESKRSAARAPKRAVVTYDAVHQAEDDVFLVVMRRLEHAAATLIQSVFRGYRARCVYADARRHSGLADEVPALTATASTEALDATARGVSVPVVPPAPRPPLPPLLEACLERLFREGDAFGALWGDYVTSPPPESRRCWLYRPVQHHHHHHQQHHPNGGDAAQPDENDTQPLATRVGEGWVQEALLLPPLRATQPRRHLNLFERLTDYLALAHCTTLQDSTQLLTDAPGMSVLQRRAYDGVKAVCLTLFHVAYAELRQRYPGANVPSSFSAYMRTAHAAVLGWFSVPHECSLLVRAVSAGGAGASAMRVRRGADVSTADAEHAMRVAVRAQLTAHETLVLAPRTLSSSGKAAAGPSSSSRSDLLLIAPHVYLAAEPLLAREEWVHAIASLVEAEGERAPDAPPLSVGWISAAPTPLACIHSTPVAAVRRSDGQRVDGVPVYDAFVPRIRGPPRRSAAAFTDDGEEPAAAGADAAATAPSIPTAGVVEAWLRGDLARAADVALVQHLYRSLATPRGLVYYRVRSRGPSLTGPDAASFTVVAPTAGLARETGVPFPQASPHADPSEPTVAGGAGLLADPSGTVSTAATPRRRSAQRGEGWERVMEAVAQEKAAAAARRSSSRVSSILTTPSASIGALGWSRSASGYATTCAGSVPRASALLGNADVDPTGASEEHDVPAEEEEAEEETRVRTVDELAKEVEAAVAPTVTLVHRRTLLCQVAGAETAARLDLFLDQVAETLQQEKYQPNVVLALELSSQGFFALVAALLAFRLHDTRDIGAWASGKLSAAAPSSAGPRAILKDPRLAFLAGFHAALEGALPTLSSSRAPVQTTAVQTSVQRVCQLLEALASPQLNVLQALQRAVSDAEAASAPSAAIMRACQLTEQYALLVLLDYYLWSNVSSLTPSGAALSARGLTVRTSGNNTFASFLAGVPAALEWIAVVDPWHPAFTTRPSPDALHTRYSNALRRWDDRRYVCFGTL